jgi:hypothetical protein
VGGDAVGTLSSSGISVGRETTSGMDCNNCKLSTESAPSGGGVSVRGEVRGEVALRSTWRGSPYDRLHSHVIDRRDFFSL